MKNSNFVLIKRLRPWYRRGITSNKISPTTLLSNSYNDDPIDENYITIANVEEEVLLLMTTLQHCYSTFQYHDDLIDNTDNTLVDN